MTTAGGNATTYLVRSFPGQPERVTGDVRAFVSKRHHRDKFPASFISTDSRPDFASGASRMWPAGPCDVDNINLKLWVGLDNFRLNRYEAVETWFVVIQMAGPYVLWRFSQEGSAYVRRYADIIRLVGHRWVYLSVRASFVTDTDRLREAGIPSMLAGRSRVGRRRQERCRSCPQRHQATPARMNVTMTRSASESYEGHRNSERKRHTPPACGRQTTRYLARSKRRFRFDPRLPRQARGHPQDCQRSH